MELIKLENEIKELRLKLRDLKNVPTEQRSQVGAALNLRLRSAEDEFRKLEQKQKQDAINEKLNKDKLIDITIPDLDARVGHLHPITRVQKEVEDVFASMGFIIEEGPEIVTEYECFDSVNIPCNHPARDMQDTFWLDDGRVLKTHTSALQNKMLKTHGPEFRAIFPGRCFRNEAVDASHENTFFQVEGMMVGADISIANLIYFMKTALSAVFKKDIKVRLRPGFFAFVEPGFELDASCVFCGGNGCGLCKGSGWIEFCGCGMIHPNVLEMGGVDPKKYQGFAFGFGLTRLAMMKYGINEIRQFNSGNLEFLRSIK